MFDFVLFPVGTGRIHEITRNRTNKLVSLRVFSWIVLADEPQLISLCHDLTFAFDFVSRLNQRLGFDEDVFDLRVPIADLRLQAIDGRRDFT